MVDTTICRLTVFFEEPFWVGVFERISENSLTVCKVTFGAMPREIEVLEFIRKNYYKLRFSPAVDVKVRNAAVNPKRVQREAKKRMQTPGIGTKSQQALQQQREQMKTERKAAGKARREAEEKRLYELKQQKRKEKHRGR